MNQLQGVTGPAGCLLAHLATSAHYTQSVRPTHSDRLSKPDVQSAGSNYLTGVRVQSGVECQETQTVRWLVVSKWVHGVNSSFSQMHDDHKLTDYLFHDELQ